MILKLAFSQYRKAVPGLVSNVLYSVPFIE